MENDSTSSPKPLCSNLENERIRLLYEKDDINLIDIDQIQRTKLDYKHINNENSTFAVKSHTLNDDSEKISYNDVSPLTISSQGNSKI